MSEVVEGKKKKTYLGHAITKDGHIRYTSVSAIKSFDKQSDGGCPRKFFYMYKLGVKLARTAALDEGADYAEKLEHYLKTGEDVLPPVLQPAKKLFPEPGPDLECEEPLGDIEKAVKLRDLMLKGAPGPWPDLLQGEIDDAAGLTFAGIPADGAADCRHTRGEFIDSDRLLKKDPPGTLVVHIDDLKTASRIFPQKIQKGPKAGVIIPAYTKTGAEVCNDVQMLGYARHAIGKYPGMTHARLSLIYANKTKREAEKRTGIISVEQILERTYRIDQVVEQMKQVATATRIEDVPPNTSACGSFTHVDPNDPTKTLKGCGYRYQCPLHASQVVTNMLGTYKESAMSLFDQVPGAVAAPPPPPAPLPPPLDDAAHAAQVAAERAKLLASFTTTAAVPAPAAVSYGFCSKCGTPLTNMNASSMPNGTTLHIGCAANAAPPAPQVVVGHNDVVYGVVVPPSLPIAVNPPDQPKAPDLIAAAGPVPPEEIAQIDDPELRARTESHAAEHARRAAAAAAAEEAAKVAAGTSVWCPSGNMKLVLDSTMAIEGYTCQCTKHWTAKALRPIKEADGRFTTVIPRHKPVAKKDEAPAADPYAAAPAPAPSAPAVPVVADPAPAAPSVSSIVAPAVPASLPPPVAQVRHPHGIDTRGKKAIYRVTKGGSVFGMIASSTADALARASLHVCFDGDVSEVEAVEKIIAQVIE